MSYKFTSKSTGDLIMLEADGRRLLEIIGKDAARKGIILPDEMDAAVQALEQAVDSEKADHCRLSDRAQAERETEPGFDEVSLRQRAVPFMDMLRRCGQDRTEIVWGV